MTRWFARTAPHLTSLAGDGKISRVEFLAYTLGEEVVVPLSGEFADRGR